MTKTNRFSEFASHRPCSFESLTSVAADDRDWVLTECWRFSRDALSSISLRLAEIDINDDIINCLAVAGSLGRMEAQAHSDCDLLIITNDGVNPGDQAVKNQVNNIWQCLNEQSLQLPKAWGIFATPISPSQLTDPQSLGNLNESREVFGKRIQLLLDCQPLIKEDNFRQIQRRILRWYATAFVQNGDDSQWLYLINDLVRYFKSYSAWHQYKLDIEHDDSWYIRDSKLKTSRLIMFAGLMFMLGSASHRTDRKLDDILACLTMTPLERVIDSFTCHDAPTSKLIELIDYYDTYYAVMADDDTRQRLVQTAPQTIQQLPPRRINGYDQIDKAGNALRAMLAEFVLDRRYDWHQKFLQAWLL